MELDGRIDTAQDLFELLSKIPPAQRDRLPVSVSTDDGNNMFTANLNVSAYETTETEGCIERGFVINTE